MILIWRGWGILAVLLALVGVGVGTVFDSALGWDGTTQEVAGPGLGLFLGGVASFFLGRWLNHTRPQERVRQHMVAREQRLWNLVRSGQFQVAPGAPSPRSEQEAREQVNALLQQEHQGLMAHVGNGNTLFFIPMQYVGALMAIVGLGMFISGLIG